ncbi:MAG: LCP family protein [Mobilitalea sp.]
MGKDDANSTFDFDFDTEFNENFNKNIEKVLGDSNVGDESAKETGIKAEEKAVNTEKSTGNDGNSAENVEATADNTEASSDNLGLNSEIAKATVSTEVLGEVSATNELQTMNEITEEEIDDRLMDINASLAKQICEELEVIGTEDMKKKRRRWLKITNGVLLTLLCLIGIGFFLGFTKPGNQLLMNMGVDLSSKIWDAWTDDFDKNAEVIPDVDYLDEEDLSSTAPEVDPTKIVWPEHPGEGRKEEGVYNILLMGEEAIGSGDGRGRTDLIIIATLNTKNETVKLTSLMRDMLVQIPGFQDNKLNTAYEKGGLELMYETIALNFNLRLDGCAMVNFENFEDIVDELGGLEITLTSGEAKYLNNTNYISNPIYRNVYEGKQLLNGNQVLGYSRVRKRATITGQNNDYGRTDRHRIVLNAIFNKYKTKSKVELATVMLKVLPMITTDIDDKSFETLLNTFIEMGTTEMSQFRIPADGTFSDNVKVRGMDVLIPDLEENVEALHSFIFGDDSALNTDSTTKTTTDDSTVIESMSNTDN